MADEVLWNVPGELGSRARARTFGQKFAHAMNTDAFTARRVWFDDTRVYVELNDGRVVGSPLAWFPRLQRATPEQRSRFEFVAGGYGIHWDELDEDLTAGGFLTYSRA